MKRAAVVVVLMILLSGCSSEAPEEVADSARCSAAQKSKKEADQFGEGMREQASNPGTAVARFHRDLENGKVFEDGIAILYSQQLSYQMVSDNPTCFRAGHVADARMNLKIIDPLMVRAHNLLAKQGKESDIRELDHLLEQEDSGNP